MPTLTDLPGCEENKYTVMCDLHLLAVKAVCCYYL